MSLASDARAILRAGIAAADPGRAVRSVVRRRQRGVLVGGRWLRPGAGGTIRLVGLGKAAAAMMDAAAAIVGRDATGVVAVPHGYPAPHSRVHLVRGDHPVPSRASLSAGRALLREVRAAEPSDRILFLISGGGSAVAEVPVETLSIDDLARTTEVLLSSGAPIQAMNAVRRHLSALKGGRLALAGPHLGFATVAISDVVGDPPEDVASGPTVGDPTTFRDALGVLERFHLRSRLPPRVSRYLARGAQGDHPETPKPTDPSLRRAVFRFGATNRTALRASAREARRRGYRPRVLPKPVVGETQPAALRFARELLRAPGRRSLALLGGGETTVTLGPHPGRGGRNQEFALATASLLAGRAGVLVLSAGTDGIDGPTDAAGGWADGTTLERLAVAGVDLGRSLHGHAAYPALDRIGGLLRTGPTGTNVTDLHVGLRRG